jgi:hypothetical protein
MRALNSVRVTVLDLDLAIWTPRHALSGLEVY